MHSSSQKQNNDQTNDQFNSHGNNNVYFNSFGSVQYPFYPPYDNEV